MSQSLVELTTSVVQLATAGLIAWSAVNDHRKTRKRRREATRRRRRYR
jgi:hypothetical protein